MILSMKFRQTLIFFADDTSLSVFVSDPARAGTILQYDINKLSQWAQKWLVKFNPSKSESLIMSCKLVKLNHPRLFMLNTEIPSDKSHKHLGMYLTNDGSWDMHIGKSIDKAWKRIGVVRFLKTPLDRFSLQIIYFSFIRPMLEYDDFSQGLKDQLDISRAKRSCPDCYQVH